uniref:Uncharacterized protein n=1 Tax=Ananas comosus var. bracteatus TaxID=296719 RepID=A0A6V7Q5J2_ANACO|nr:unnamed protein product [Ananas comosus var. bracteatus]
MFRAGPSRRSLQEPRRCLLCMKIGHPASRCRFLPGSSRGPMDPGPSSRRFAALPPSAPAPGPSSGRPSFLPAFLPPRPPPPGLPSLSACVARAEVLGPSGVAVEAFPDAKDALSRGLAARYGGTSREFLVADFAAPALAVFFPNWVSRESAVSRSPLRFDGFVFKLSNWVEAAELDRGHLRCKAWIRLLHWPILCWNEEDVKAATSGFGKLWHVDRLSESRTNVSFFRALVRCPDVHSIPEALHLTIEDRRFHIPVEVESWEEANPIFLGEDLDARLGLETSEAQDRFIRQTGFSSIPAQGSLDWPHISRGDPHRHSSSGGAARPTAPAAGTSSFSNPSSPALLPRPPPSVPRTSCAVLDRPADGTGDKDGSARPAVMEGPAVFSLPARLASDTGAGPFASAPPPLSLARHLLGALPLP